MPCAQSTIRTRVGLPREEENRKIQAGNGTARTGAGLPAYAGQPSSGGRRAEGVEVRVKAGRLPFGPVPFPAWIFLFSSSLSLWVDRASGDDAAALILLHMRVPAEEGKGWRGTVRGRRDGGCTHAHAHECTQSESIWKVALYDIIYEFT